MPALCKNLKVTVNGSVMELENGFAVADLLRKLDLNLTMVAVELNAQIVPKIRYAEQVLSDGDVLEIVHFVGGG